MKKILIMIAIVAMAKAALAQNQLPVFSYEALVISDSANHSTKGDYKLLIYGAIHCSYSRYLVDNLNALDDCEKMEIIVLLNDSKDSIVKEYPELIKSYRVYSNDVLKHQLAKNNDITPQTFLFKNNEQLLHIKGVKKKMFLKIEDQVNCQ